MSHSDQNQSQGIVYELKDIEAGPYQVPPPQSPITHQNKDFLNGETKLKGRGFWRGCCAAMCCYCCLDICF